MELLLPMPVTVCIEAGRSTLTHTSWTQPGSRKWMSGQAAAVAATQNRRRFANKTRVSMLREPILRSARRPPSPLDFYLSWMSLKLVDCMDLRHPAYWKMNTGWKIVP